MPPRKSSSSKQVESIKHGEDKRKNIPTAEHQSVMADEERRPIRVAYERRNPDLDPQLVWRGKDMANWSDLVVSAPPLYIQEKVHPKVLVDDLLKQSQERAEATQPQQLGFDLFADFDGLTDATATDFYKHDANWSNRMILGDSLQVMASLAEREGLRGKVQCIYLDPPYGIKFNSNFQWSTTSRDVKDGKLDNITREPEQVKAFRDTWRDGIHSYLTYLRDRLTVARDLLTDSGSIFVQIGDENVHLVRALMDEIFGSDNFCSLISYLKTSAVSSPTAKLNSIASVSDYIIWFSKNQENLKYRQLYYGKDLNSDVSGVYRYIREENGTLRKLTEKEKVGIDSTPSSSRIYRIDNFTSTGWSEKLSSSICREGKKYSINKNLHWKTHPEGCGRLIKGERLQPAGVSLGYIRYLDDFAVYPIVNNWRDTGTGSFTDEKLYVVQTASKAIQRCILMASDPGDLVLDPTCGSGTTAYVAEQWGRRWITIDTSRVALALARARIMGARYPYYLLSDSPEGQKKEAEITRNPASQSPTYRNIRQGFVYERVPHITLKAIANNVEIDIIYEQWQPKVEEALADLNTALAGHPKPYAVTTGGRDGKKVDFTASGTVKLPSGEDAPANGLLEWEVPRVAPTDWPQATHEPLERFWEARIGRQKEIDASIAAKADQEYLYDKPYEDKNIVRVAGPFTVESLSPHRVLVVDENDELIDPAAPKPNRSVEEKEFADIILENLKVAGVQQAHKQDKITFTTLVPWPGEYICAEGRYIEGESEAEKRAGIFIGPEFGTVSRADLVAATREAGDAGFDVLISCAFNYDAHSAEFTKLGRIPVLKARMNADLHMADTLKNTGAGNLFVIFGEPDIDINPVEDGQIQVKIHGIDVFHPQSGEVRSSSSDEIACWFIDTDYNEESFFVRHAYFLGASDPYKSLKTTLKAEIDEEAWESLYSDTSRPFDKPRFGRIAVKVINHLGDEVMKVFSVE